MKSWIMLIVVFGFCLMGVSAQTTEPILVSNTQMHSAAIWKISSDAKGSMVLTGSADKTAKLWNAGSGELLRTFRPPIGSGHEGKVHSCALSPDGLLVAIGGATGYEWDTSYSVYIFNAATGVMIKRLSLLSNLVLELEFSPDGKYLAVGSGYSSGLRIYLTADWSLHKALTGYNAAITNLAFDASGKMASVCLDGKIRLYDKTFNLIRERKFEDDMEPYSLAFHPDGSKIAVGFQNHYRLLVLSAKNLQTVLLPDITDADTMESNLEILCYSADGRFLYGGFSYQQYSSKGWKRMLRQWDLLGSGSYQDFPICTNIVMDLKPLPNNNMLFSGSYPDWGIISPTGTLIHNSEAETNDFRATDKSHLRINSNGKEIGFTPRTKSALSFSLSNRSLKTAQSSFSGPKDSSSSLKITDWNAYPNPKLNAMSMAFLDSGDRCLGVDISDDEKRIVAGTDFEVCCLDQSGNLIWDSDAPAAVFNVNISDNGRVVLCALNNGNFNWYRMSDGELLLTLFVHPDARRWIVYTPNGYYDCAPGSEDLIGWHLNNGKEREASFYPFSQFRNTYYRPDVIDQVLDTMDLSEALQLANEAGNRKQQQAPVSSILPPSVSILSPLTNSSFNTDEITLSYSLITPNNEPVTNLKVMIDGRPADSQKGLKPLSNKSSIKVKVPPRDLRIGLIAENKFGSSELTEIVLKWTGSKEQDTDLFKPTLYVLAVGISSYNNPDYKLNYSAKDAVDFVAAIQNQKGKLYKEIKTQVYTDANASKENILDGLDWIQKQCTSRDLAIIFFSGHGMNDNTGLFYYLPVAADKDRLKSTCLPFSDLKNTLGSIAGKVIVFADACHSGNIYGDKNFKAPDLNYFINELSSSETGAVIFTSSTGKQFSVESSKWKNGAFTKALIEGLSGAADYRKKGAVSVKALDLYIAERVKELTDGAQSPTTIIPHSISDFDIAITP